MIIKEPYMTRPDGVELEISFSDQGLQILGENGAAYDNAVDPVELHRTYIETRFMTDNFDVQIDYWLRQINAGEVIIDDVPEAFRDDVRAKMNAEEQEQLVTAAKIMMGEEE